MGKACKYCENDLEEEMIQCATCRGYCHPSCLELPSNIVPNVKTYDWQCNDCKYCYACQDIANEEQILFCDTCDRGYHMYCIKPALKKKPKGDWFCPICKERRSVMSVKPADSAIQQEVNIPKSNEQIDQTKIESDAKQALDLKKPCPIGKKYSPQKVCPFPGCDGTGNIRTANSVHFSVNMCPLSKEERKRERELLDNDGMKENDEEEPLSKLRNTETENLDQSSTSKSPTKKKSETSPLSTEHEKTNSNKNHLGNNENDKSTHNETPIEHIVSRTDIEMFEAAKRKAQEVLALDREMAPAPDGLKNIIFGDVEIEAWYKSQYPLEFSRLPKLYICEFCLEYMKTETIYKRHIAKCTTRHPPGDEIYRKEKLSVFEVNGQTATSYCQNLCLMAKLFLDHKTLWLDVAPFLFYVMTIADNRGCHMVGYFSKEKVSFLNYNVSCILVLPHYMRMGYGKMLIDFSYLLSQEEGKTGSPERPLSDLGLISYRKFWADKLLRYLMGYNEEQISIKGISEKMSIHPNDVISTLQYLGMLKYWKGKHLILLRKEIMEEYASKVKDRLDGYKEIDPKCLTWTPIIYK